MYVGVHGQASRVNEAPTGFAELVPDVAVEVVSADDRPRDVLDKVGEYVQAGVRLVWVVDPRKRQANIYRSLTDVQVIDEGGALDGDHVLPGFHCPMAEVLG